MRKRLYVLFVFIVLFSDAFAQKKTNILFVGNSLTYTNNIPELVKLIASCDSIELNCNSLSHPNYALEDHWNDGVAAKEIKSKTYDFVVVQQGPSSQTEGRLMLLNDGLRFANLCKENQTQLAFYMVWPAKARSFDFPGVVESYTMVADSTKSILCPAGSAWLRVWQTFPQFRLYGADEFHPNTSGSFLAALVIYGSLMKKSELSFVEYSRFKKMGISNKDFQVLVQAAMQTLAEK